MKKLSFILVCSSFLLLTNCKKKDTRNFSYWQVNQDKYSSNNVRFDKGKAITVFSCSDIGNNFYFSSIPFHFYFSGIYPFKQSASNNPDSISVAFYYKGNCYIPLHSGYLKTDNINGKIQCTMLPTWYSNYYDSKDTVLINGTFNEP